MPGGVSGSTCSGVRAVPGPAAPCVDGAGLGRVVGDVASPLGVGLVGGTGAGAELVVGSWAWAVVLVPAVVAAGVTDGRVGSEAVLETVPVGPLAEPAVGQPVDAWTAGACVDTLSTWGPELAVGLAVELPGVCWEGLCVPIGAWAVMTGPVVG